MTWWIRTMITHRISVLALTSLVTLAALFSLRSLKVIIDPDEALPQTHPYVVANNEVEKVFGNKLTSVIGVHSSGSVLEPDTLARIARITARLEKASGVVPKSVASIGAKDFRIPLPSPAGAQFLSVEEARKKLGEERLGLLLGNSPFAGLLVSGDLHTAQIVAEFKKIPEGFGQIDREIREAIAPEQNGTLEFWVGGVPAFLSLLEKYSGRMAYLFPLALLVIGLIHYEAFRTVQALVLPLVTALLSVIWALGLLGLFRQPVDVFNASTPILILAVAAGHAVQILKRYYEEFAILREQGGLPPAEMSRAAVLNSLVKVGPVMVAACFVAALGFFSLVVFEIKSIQVFGLFTGAGVLSALVLELTFIPALRAILPPPGEKEYLRERQPSAWDHFAARLFQLVLEKKTALFGFAAILFSLCAFAATRVEVENSQKSYFWGKIDERRDDDLLNERMSGTNSLYLLVEAPTGQILRPDVLAGVEKLQTYLGAQPIVGKSVSVVDLLKGLNQAAHGGDPRFATIPENLPALTEALRAQGASLEGAASFVNAERSIAKVQIFLRTDRTRQVESLIKDLDLRAKQVLPTDLRYRIGGGVAGGVALNEVMVREKILNILQIMGAVFLVSALVFRSLVAGALILLPLVAAVLANFGVMGAFGIPLQIATALVSAMAVGIGADYGIYLSYRLREELAVPGRVEKDAIKKAFLSAGKATLFVSSAVAGGFGVLMLSIGFNVHFWMGLLIGVSMLVSALTALTLFPALVLVLRPKFIFGRGMGGQV